MLLIGLGAFMTVSHASGDDEPCADPVPRSVASTFTGAAGTRIAVPGKTGTLPFPVNAREGSMPVVVYSPEDTYVGVVLLSTDSGTIDLRARAQQAIPITLQVTPSADWTLWIDDILVGKPPLDLRIDPGVVALRLERPSGESSVHMLYTVKPPTRKGERTLVVLEP